MKLSRFLLLFMILRKIMSVSPNNLLFVGSKFQQKFDLSTLFHTKYYLDCDILYNAEIRIEFLEVLLIFYDLYKKPLV